MAGLLKMAFYKILVVFLTEVDFSLTAYHLRIW